MQISKDWVKVFLLLIHTLFVFQGPLSHLKKVFWQKKKKVFGVKRRLISTVLYSLVNSSSELQFAYMVLYGKFHNKYPNYVKCLKITFKTGFYF